jgi:hypothetical protein
MKKPTMQVRINEKLQPKVRKAAEKNGRTIPMEVNRALYLYYADLLSTNNLKTL